jgi:iron complex outermembrane recepter protein
MRQLSSPAVPASPSRPQPASRRFRQAMTATALPLLLSGALLAQESAADADARSETDRPRKLGPIDEMVVTARRREESLQDVPAAVTAFSERELQRSGVEDIVALGARVPNVTLEVSRGTNTTLTPFIRGVGQQDPVAGFEQGVGIYIDDVYLNRPQGAVLQIYEIERVEVLRGPQGTLYGRNTIGGAVKYVTRAAAASDRPTQSWPPICPSATACAPVPASPRSRAAASATT